MSNRPRSHQIEDISIRRFEDALPSAWVSRRIIPDYGVDQEVEIFTASDQSTGIKFAIQLKATDDASQSNRVKLEVSQLKYLLDYDLPGIVVRFDASADVLRWQWANIIATQTQLRPDQKTFTHRFEEADIWDENTPTVIERTLRARRALANFPASTPMPVRLEVADSVSNARYAIERAVREIIAGSSGTLISADADLATVELHIRVREGFLSVDFGMLGSMTFDLDVNDPKRLRSAILYAMAFLFAQKRLAGHSRAAGTAILDGNHVAGNDDLVARASRAFADDAMAQAELAILNDLHAPDSLYYPVVVGNLIEVGRRKGGPEAVARFLAAALDTAKDDPARAASIHYSTANALRAAQPARALFHYNRARHLRPSYLEADYFLSELAGTLFTARRYACAVIGYSRALAIAPDFRLQVCLGDAHLFSGDVQSAARSFELASQSDVAQLVEEAAVKLELCNMLIASHGPSIPIDWSCPMGDVPEGEDERAAWISQLESVNALDPLAHFNLGVSDAKLDDYASALGHFIACATVQLSDTEAWTNAIISAFRTGQDQLVITLIHLSIRVAGLDAYDALRANLLKQGGEPSLLEELDAIAFAADARSDPSFPTGVTLRILDGDHAEVVGQTNNQ